MKSNKLFGTHSQIQSKVSKVNKIFIAFISSLLLSINYSDGQTYGCTDPLATNYNPTAVINDGNCIYNSTSISPFISFNLANELLETSGII